jgi:hypothetical protein
MTGMSKGSTSRTRTWRRTSTFVVTYVDDIIVNGNSPDEIRKTNYFATEFKKISDLEEVSQ